MLDKSKHVYNPKDIEAEIRELQGLNENYVSYSISFVRSSKKAVIDLAAKLNEKDANELVESIRGVYRSINGFKLGIRSSSDEFNLSKKVFNGFLVENRANIQKIFINHFKSRVEDEGLVNEFTQWMDNKMPKSIEGDDIFDFPFFEHEWREVSFDFVDKDHILKQKNKESSEAGDYNSTRQSNGEMTLEKARALLGFSENDSLTLKAVKTAYRKKALKVHPEKNPDNPKAAEEEFKALGTAFALLEGALQ